MGTERMHMQEQLLEELPLLKGWTKERGAIHWTTVTEWWAQGYSTSAHLKAMQELCLGLKARRIGEIGFGRSSFLLAIVARCTDASFITCDRYDYQYMLKMAGIDWVEYLHGDVDYFFERGEAKGFDFIFLDYMSTRKKSVESCYKDLKKALKLLPTNGMMAVHDALGGKYNVAEALEMLKKKYGSKIEVLTLPYGYGLGLIKNRMESKYGVIKDTWKKKPDDRP